MFKKILVPLDGSELAAKILPHVIEMAKCMSSQITLLHVCHFPSAAAVESLSPDMIKDAEDREAKECALFLGKAAEEMQSQGLNVNHECVEGVPAREIIAYAQKNNTDLIAHGYSW